MEEQFFTIPAEVWMPPEPAARRPTLLSALAALFGAGGAPRLTARWMTADGAPAGPEIPLETRPSHWIEHLDDEGRFGHARARPAVSFAGERPAAAAMLELADRGRRIARIPDAALMRSAALPAPARARVGSATARLVIPVFSERFTEQATFLAAVEQLHGWILDQPPFDREGVGANLAFETHFWPSDPDVGRFNTPDSASQGGRLFHGDRALAKQLLDPFIGNAATSLVLIDSARRGGAGGVRGFSAWSSVAGRGGGERWEAIVLHELGHGFGLADEYLDSRLENEEPQGEPNVCADPRPLGAPWRDLVTLPDQPAPSFGLDNAGGSPDAAVGTFQGARYRTDLFRPARSCLMRDTGESFCAVCCEHLVRLTR